VNKKTGSDSEPTSLSTSVSFLSPSCRRGDSDLLNLSVYLSAQPTFFSTWGALPRNPNCTYRNFPTKPLVLVLKLREESGTRAPRVKRNPGSNMGGDGGVIAAKREYMQSCGDVFGMKGGMAKTALNRTETAELRTKVCKV